MAELIDVSNVNGSVAWSRVRQAGITGVWLKATEGHTYVDALYASHRTRAQAAGLRVGAYHFARPDRNAARDEAVHFCDVVGAIGRRDLRPVLDLEHDCDLHPRELEAWARTFNRTVESKRNVIPIFYSYPYFIRHLNPATPIGNGLWLADYSVNDGTRHAPIIPSPWKRCVAHQYTSKGTVAGVNGHVDRSYAPRLTGVLAHPVLGLL